MSIETLLAEQTAAITTNTSTMDKLIAALAVTAQNQERLIAGQAAAIDKVEGAKTTRKTKAEKEAEALTGGVVGNAEPAATVSGVAGATTAAEPKVISEDDLRTLATGWITADGAEKGSEIYKTRGTFMAGVASHLGSPTLAGPKATLDADGRKKAHFYISRKKAGHDVDFGVDYDFDGPHDQDTASAPVDEEEDDLGIG